MNTKTPRTPCIALPLLGLLLILAGCSTSTDNGPDCRYDEAWLNGECRVDPLPLVLPSGIWSGTDTAARDVLMLVSGNGTFQFIDGVHNQGSWLSHTRKRYNKGEIGTFLI